MVSGSMLETGLSLNRVSTVGEQMLEGLRSLDRNQESIGKESEKSNGSSRHLTQQTGQADTAMHSSAGYAARPH
ncbi:MAG: hypothetical protein CM15mP54_27580 [Paracoccaceae bacterium]|nr:MAG: hypothetical protein CM15mP54_27580 [Paracoccaceae bacterium]